MLQPVAEYFAGIGLVRMGLEPAEWHVIYANDYSEKKFEMYESFYPDSCGHYVVDDVSKLSLNKIPHTTRQIIKIRSITQNYST